MVETQEDRFAGSCRSAHGSRSRRIRSPTLRDEWIRSGRGVEVVSEAEFVAVRGLGCPTAPAAGERGREAHVARGHLAPGLQVHFDSLREMIELLPA